MTSRCGVARGRPPKYFDGNAQAFSALRFHFGSETFSFHQPIKMRDDPLYGPYAARHAHLSGGTDAGTSWFAIVAGWIDGRAEKEARRWRYVSSRFCLPQHLTAIDVRRISLFELLLTCPEVLL